MGEGDEGSEICEKVEEYEADCGADKEADGCKDKRKALGKLFIAARRKKMLKEALRIAGCEANGDSELCVKINEFEEVCGVDKSRADRKAAGCKEKAKAKRKLLREARKKKKEEEKEEEEEEVEDEDEDEATLMNGNVPAGEKLE